MLVRAGGAHFQNTGINPPVDLCPVLAYMHGGVPRCCVFEGQLQPRLLDRDHFHVSVGSGTISADPFLRLLSDIYCRSGPPNVREGGFLAVWAVDYAIQTSPGGVAKPIRVATLEQERDRGFVAREPRNAEIAQHRWMINKIYGFIRDGTKVVGTSSVFGDFPPFPDFDEA